jgi:ATP-dependent protease HslVU (ClpYQ) peptidase subunit
LTVIAFDGKTLVADGRCTGNGATLINDDYNKVFEITIPSHGKCLVALCGALDMQGPLLEHLKANGFKPIENMLADEEDMFMRGLVLTKKGVCYEISSNGGWYIAQGPTAMGSGGMIAQHYLTKGCDALTAVVEACKTELTCGGTIRVYDLKTGDVTVHNQDGSLKQP